MNVTRRPTILLSGSHESEMVAPGTEPSLFSAQMVLAYQLSGPKVSITRQPSYQGQAQMKFNRETPIWRGHKPAFADAHDFRRHLLLLLEIADVFDHGVAIHHVKRLIGPGQFAGVANDGINLGIVLLNECYMFCRNVETCDSAFPRIPIDELQRFIFIRVGLGAHIEHAHGVGGRESALEQLQLTRPTNIG